MISTILFFQFFTSQNCTSKEGDGATQSWLNVKYIECLKNQLPCECEKITAGYYALTLNTNKNSKNYGVELWETNENEPDRYDIKDLGELEFEIMGDPAAEGEFKLSIIGDSLYLTRKGQMSRFIKSKESKKYSIKYHEIVNVDLLNDALRARGYNRLEKIVKEDSLRCYCNMWMGNVNFLYVRGAPKSWIMTLKNDSLSIQRITNIDRDPDDPVQTEKVIDLKWK